MGTITGAHHVALTVTDVDKSRAWYSDLLGMSCVLEDSIEKDVDSSEQHENKQPCSLFEVLRPPGSYPFRREPRKPRSRHRAISGTYCVATKSRPSRATCIFRS